MQDINTNIECPVSVWLIHSPLKPLLGCKHTIFCRYFSFLVKSTYWQKAINIMLNEYFPAKIIILDKIRSLQLCQDFHFKTNKSMVQKIGHNMTFFFLSQKTGPHMNPSSGSPWIIVSCPLILHDKFQTSE